MRLQRRLFGPRAADVSYGGLNKGEQRQEELRIKKSVQVDV